MEKSVASFAVNLSECISLCSSARLLLLVMLAPTGWDVKEITRTLGQGVYNILKGYEYKFFLT